MSMISDTTEPELTEMSVDEILNGIPGSNYQVVPCLSWCLGHDDDDDGDDDDEDNDDDDDGDASQLLTSCC